MRDFRELPLDAARQLILTLRRDEGILAGHFQVAVAGNFRRLDSTAAHLLPPGNVRTPERIGPETLKVTTL